MYEYLVVVREGVWEIHELVASCSLDEFVDVRKRKKILWAGPIEICDVYANSPFPILLLDYVYIGHPLWILDLS